MNKKATKKNVFFYFKIAVIPFLSFFLLTGCSELVEIQDRDFALALGVSLKDGQYELTFALPDLSALAKDDKKEGKEEGNGQIRSYQNISLPAIEDMYNRGSNKQLDYRHMEALILDHSISSSIDKLTSFLEYIDNNYQFSRNVLVFYYPGDVKSLIEEKGNIGGGIGNYLKELENTNARKNGIKTVTVGNLKNSLSQNKSQIVPLLELANDKLEVNGAAIFQNYENVKQLDPKELNSYYVIKGIGKELNFHVQEELIFKLKECSRKAQYLYENNKPMIRLNITGTAEELSDSYHGTDLGSAINDYLKTAISDQLDKYLKVDKIDYLNLYDESGMKNKDMWLAYQNRHMEFIDDVEIELDIDIIVQ